MQKTCILLSFPGFYNEGKRKLRGERRSIVIEGKRFRGTKNWREKRNCREGRKTRGRLIERKRTAWWHLILFSSFLGWRSKSRIGFVCSQAVITYMSFARERSVSRKGLSEVLSTAKGRFKAKGKVILDADRPKTANNVFTFSYNKTAKISNSERFWNRENTWSNEAIQMPASLTPQNVCY